MSSPNLIAVIANRADRDSQRLLAEAAQIWRERGDAVAGVLAELPGEPAACSAGFLRDIVSGRRFSMALDQLAGDTRCHLDADGVQGACAQLLPQIHASDVILLSKFGKLEAGRKGLWGAFAEAIAAGKPLLTTVSAKHVEAWEALAPSSAWLEPEPTALAEWWDAVSPRART